MVRIWPQAHRDRVVNLPGNICAATKSKPRSIFLGRNQVKAHELVDAIVEITETGFFVAGANKLRIVDTLLTSTHG